MEFEDLTVEKLQPSQVEVVKSSSAQLLVATDQGMPPAITPPTALYPAVRGPPMGLAPLVLELLTTSELVTTSPSLFGNNSLLVYLKKYLY